MCDQIVFENIYQESHLQIGKLVHEDERAKNIEVVPEKIQFIRLGEDEVLNYEIAKLKERFVFLPIEKILTKKAPERIDLKIDSVPMSGFDSSRYGVIVHPDLAEIFMRQFHPGVKEKLVFAGKSYKHRDFSWPFAPALSPFRNKTFSLGHFYCHQSSRVFGMLPILVAYPISST